MKVTVWSRLAVRDQWDGPLYILLPSETLERTDRYEAEKKRICEIFHENNGRYGYRRITMQLHNEGIALNHKTVERLMKELGLKCLIRKKRYRSYKGTLG
ncbi:MAG: transposase [Bacteroides sp.]|nr:transposase [Bacteroides sp.]